MACTSGSVLFRALDLFPIRPDFVNIFDLCFSEDVRMAANEFFDKHPANTVKIERLSFARQLTVENDLQQQIAELLGHFVVVTCLDGVNQFINFLNGVAAQGHVRLLTVPWATGRGTQPGHDAKQILDGAFLFHGARGGRLRE